jgi:preprotein translocase subunit YajC
MHTPFFLQAGAQGGGFESLLFMLGLFVILYFFMIRPQMQRQKKEKQFRANLAKGDKVITIGGIHGKIISLDDNSALLAVDENVKIRFERAAIREYASKTEEVAKK